MLTFYIIEKRISKFQIFAIFMSALFTLFAYWFDNDQFVKIQPTIFNGFFSFVLLVGIVNKKAMMKQFFGSEDIPKNPFDQQQLKRIFRKTLSRFPEEEELDLIENLWNDVYALDESNRLAWRAVLVFLFRHPDFIRY